MKNVLVVEGYPMLLVMWKAALLGTPINIVGATTMEEARRGFADNKGELDAIVINACIASDSGQKASGPNAFELVAEFRKEFKGPMIASSHVPEWREWLMKAGCNLNATDKIHIPRILKELLAV